MLELNQDQFAGSVLARKQAGKHLTALTPGDYYQIFMFYNLIVVDLFSRRHQTCKGGNGKRVQQARSRGGQQVARE